MRSQFKNNEANRSSSVASRGDSNIPNIRWLKLLLLQALERGYNRGFYEGYRDIGLLSALKNLKLAILVALAKFWASVVQKITSVVEKYPGLGGVKKIKESGKLQFTLDYTKDLNDKSQFSSSEYAVPVGRFHSDTALLTILGLLTARGEARFANLAFERILNEHRSWLLASDEDVDSVAKLVQLRTWMKNQKWDSAPGGSLQTLVVRYEHFPTPIFSQFALPDPGDKGFNIKPYRTVLPSGFLDDVSAAFDDYQNTLNNIFSNESMSATDSLTNLEYLKTLTNNLLNSYEEFARKLSPSQVNNIDRSLADIIEFWWMMF